jgi:hypothetical protein
VAPHHLPFGGTEPITIIEGTTFEKPWWLRGRDKVTILEPVGLQARGSIWRRDGPRGPVGHIVDFTCELDVPEGLVTISLDSNQTRLMGGREGVYAIELFDDAATPTVIELVRGPVNVRTERATP